MFFIAVLVLIFLSLGLAFFSLWRELKKTHEKKVQEVQQSLAKGRVLFYSPSSSTRET